MVAVLILAFAKTPMSEDAGESSQVVRRQRLTYRFTVEKVEIIDTFTKQLDEKLLPLVQGREKLIDV